jgi:hypothetical protein
VDSIPAIFAVTTNTFIVYTSNVFAILGLRSTYFLLAGVVERFHYLKLGLAIVLTFIGTKMLVLAAGIHIPIEISLVVVAVVLLSAVAASILWPKDAEMDVQVDLPEGFEAPFEDVELEPSQEFKAVLSGSAKATRIETDERIDAEANGAIETVNDSGPVERQ